MPSSFNCNSSTSKITLLPAKESSSNTYRYGFNGKENDDEIKGEGNITYFGARIYEGRLGRWLSVAPFSTKFAFLSTYIFTNNNPVLFVDNRLIRELDVVKTWKENYPKEDFPSSHKYICIINADGDAIGTLLSEIPEAALPALSKALSNFGRMAESLINEYGGLPVYIGGDDLFFFAPYRNVYSSAQNTSTDVKGYCNNIFLLLDELNRQLVLSIKQFCIDNHLKTSLDDKHIGLTFGLSVTYHKFPMDEAIEISRNLMRVGKRIEWNKTVIVNNVVRNIKIKNNMNVSLMLHSGTFFTATFNLDKDRREPFRALLQLLDQYITKKEDVDLKSVIDTLLRNGTILKLLLSEKNAKQRISNFFKNNFDEEEHQKFKEFFETVTDCLMAAKDNAVKLGYSDDWVLDQTYDALRLARFVNQTDDHE